MDVFSSFLIKGEFNLSSSLPQTQPIDNRTIQGFVKDYVDEYVGEYCVERHILYVCFVRVYLYKTISYAKLCKSFRR